MRKKKTASRPKRSSLLLVLAISVLVAYLFGPKWWPIVEAYAVHLAVIGFLVASLGLYRLVRRLRLASSMAEIDTMGGHEFERYLKRLFKRLGYSAKNVGASGADFGADLVIEKDGIKTAVQAKRYLRGRVGNDAVQQAIAGATYYDCHRAMVITNAHYTKAAREQADKCAMIPVVLWNREDLEEVLGSRFADRIGG